MVIRFIKSDRGSITAFLCMISAIALLLIISLISVLRFRWEKTQVIRSGRISVSSEFSKYYRPLFDKYKMFYYIESGQMQMQAGVTGYFMKNQEQMPDALKLTPSYVDIVQKMYATDSEAANVEKQMCADFVYEGLEKLIGNSESIYDSDNVLSDIENEITELKDMAEVEKQVLDLLYTVEGVSVSGGDVSCKDNFVKKAVFGEITPAGVGIDSDIVWKKVKKKYWRADEQMEVLDDMVKAALKGENTDFPSEDIKEWKEKLMMVREETVKAHRIAENIVSSIRGNSDTRMICDIRFFENALTNNERILDKIILFADKTKPKTKEEWREYEAELDDLNKMISEYEIKALSFDYSGLVQNKCEDPRADVRTKVNGIIDLLIDDKTELSSKSVSEANIYKKLISENEVEAESNIIYKFDDDFDGLAGFISECSEGMDVESDENALINKVAILTYINSHFASFCEQDINVLEEKALDYEREYIVACNKSDIDNLKEIANKLLITRTGISLIRIVSDGTCRNEAYVTALALVGFTGMDALVRCVQYSILAAWSYEDACVDVAALFAGKKIPFVKGNSLNISYSEIIQFGEELIQQKINENNNSIGLDYNMSLNSMMILQNKSDLIYKAMDLIQYNMKLNFSAVFSFQKAVYGAKVKIGCYKPYKSECEIIYEYE